jgi:hypothetical protein
MKKFILSICAVSFMAIVSCSKDKACSCNDGGDATAKTAIELYKTNGVLGSEAGCNTSNTALKLISDKASCSWS